MNSRKPVGVLCMIWWWPAIEWAALGLSTSNGDNISLESGMGDLWLIKHATSVQVCAICHRGAMNAVIPAAGEATAPAPIHLAWPAAAAGNPVPRYVTPVGIVMAVARSVCRTRSRLRQQPLQRKLAAAKAHRPRHQPQSPRMHWGIPLVGLRLLQASL